MIITWNTDPSQGDFTDGDLRFSSYYQYDSVSRKLVRIRLELGREEDTGQPRVIYYENRAIGFSEIDYALDEEGYPDSAFAIDHGSGKIAVIGEELSQEPRIGFWVVDMSEGKTEPHFGNVVSSKINLPDGIEKIHLQLLANNAIINHGAAGSQQQFLVASTASADELSQAIKNNVQGIVGKVFNEIKPEDLSAKLKSQNEQIATMN